VEDDDPKAGVSGGGGRCSELGDGLGGGRGGGVVLVTVADSPYPVRVLPPRFGHGRRELEAESWKGCPAHFLGGPLFMGFKTI